MKFFFIPLYCNPFGNFFFRQFLICSNFNICIYWQQQSVYIMYDVRLISKIFPNSKLRWKFFICLDGLVKTLKVYMMVFGLGCCHRNFGPFDVTNSHFTGTLIKYRHLKIAQNLFKIVKNVVNNDYFTKNSQIVFFSFAQTFFFFYKAPIVKFIHSREYAPSLNPTKKSEEIFFFVLCVETFLTLFFFYKWLKSYFKTQKFINFYKKR